jgi:hypothetical protein
MDADGFASVGPRGPAGDGEGVRGRMKKKIGQID